MGAVVAFAGPGGLVVGFVFYRAYMRFTRDTRDNKGSHNACARGRI
jgi:hypothetical protein